MSDLISRQAAIEILAFGEKYFRHLVDDIHVDGYEREKCEWGIYLIETYIAGMKDLPSAQPEQRWIPVSERLPDSAKPVLVVNEDGKYAIAFYHYIDKMWGYEWRLMYEPYDDDVWENNEHGVIVAWMPLPEPYEDSGCCN